MKRNQKYLPKFWIVHHPNNEEVVIQTAHPARDKSIEIAIRLVRGVSLKEEPWEYMEDHGWKCELMQISFANEEIKFKK